MSLDGYLELSKELELMLDSTENVSEVLESAAQLFVTDLLKMPKPKSDIRKSGYTHLIDSFAYKKSNHKSNEIEVGWGKYYGRMVEEGTRKTKRQPHLKPTYERNKIRYAEHMIKKLNLK